MKLFGRALFMTLLLLPAIAAGEPRWHTAQVRIAASIDQVVDALERPCRVLQWMPDLETVEMLEHDASGQSLVYMRSKARWPFLPRDAVLVFSRRDDAGSILITMWALPDARPPQEGYVRIPASDAHWSLSHDNGTTLVDYRSRVEPGGQVPQWLSDRFAGRSVSRAVTALRDHVLEYKTGKVPAGCAAAGDNNNVRPDR